MRRAAELAAGAVNEVLQDLSSLAYNNVSDCLSAELSVEDRSLTLKDFEFAKSYGQFALVSKLHHWQELPWLIIGMTHHQQMQARAVAKQALDAYDMSLRRSSVCS